MAVYIARVLFRPGHAVCHECSWRRKGLFALRTNEVAICYFWLNGLGGNKSHGDAVAQLLCTGEGHHGQWRMRYSSMKQTSATHMHLACQSRGCPLGEETELVPGGCDVEVTFENRLQYIQKVG